MSSDDSHTSAEVRRAEELASKAESSTVTKSCLLGDESYYEKVISFIPDGEQPEFLFPLTAGITAKPALIIQQSGQSREEIKKTKGGSVILTDRQIRIHSEVGEWTIPYHSIETADRIGHPGFEISTTSKTYIIRVAGSLYDFTRGIAQGIEYIRDMQEQTRTKQSEKAQTTGSDTTNSPDEDPMETLEKLKQMHENGLITDDEYQSKKQEVLDRM